MLLPPERDAVGLAVGLVNTWDVFEPNPECLRDVEVLRRLLRYFGHDEPAARARPADVRRVRRVRDRIRAAFEADDEAAAIEILNEVARGAGAVPHLGRADRGWRFQYATRPDPASFLGAEAAVALLDVIRTDGWDRFGLCAGSPCCCVYVDRSRNRSRRYCSQLCADRVTQAAYRRRRRAQDVRASS
jgi:predicted RNA-binding Zn ribbon-like protein